MSQILDIRVVNQKITLADGEEVQRYQQQILRDDGEGWKPVTVIQEQMVQVEGGTVRLQPTAWIETDEGVK